MHWYMLTNTDTHTKHSEQSDCSFISGTPLSIRTVSARPASQGTSSRSSRIWTLSPLWASGASSEGAQWELPHWESSIHTVGRQSPLHSQGDLCAMYNTSVHKPGISFGPHFKNQTSCIYYRPFFSLTNVSIVPIKQKTKNVIRKLFYKPLYYASQRYYKIKFNL